MNTVDNRGVEVTARIDRLPSSGLAVRARLVIGAVTFFDGFDQLLIAYALPALRAEYRLNAISIAFTITVGAIGMLIGALFSGKLADRFGRVPVVMACLVLYSSTSLFAALAPSLELLQTARFLQGIGIGGEVLVAATYISEIIGPKNRGRFVLVYELAFIFGLAAAALVSTWVVPSFGWRTLFAVGALPLLLAIALRTVPESPRWLASRGRYDEADAVVVRFETSARARHGVLPDVLPSVTSAPILKRASVLELFRGQYLRRTVVVSVLWFTSFLVNYGIASWLPTIYTSVFRLDVSTALTYSMITTFAGLLGNVIIATTVDKVGRLTGLVAGMLCGAVVLCSGAVVAPSEALHVMVFVSVAAVFVFSVNLALNLYGPELYPTRSRAAGASIGGVCARLGVIAGPIVTGFAFSSGGGLVMVFAVLAGTCVVGGVTVALFGVETARQPLETLSP